jgi:hypothetical protein
MVASSVGLSLDLDHPEVIERDASPPRDRRGSEPRRGRV